ncbi:MAG: Maf family protein [Chloroflexota bacterium]
MNIVLASASPRRSELLARAGIVFEVVPSDAHERSAFSGENSRAYALELARLKASAVALERPEATVLAADTVVSVDGIILGKPRDPKDALCMLSLLSGGDHTVLTAVACQNSSRTTDACVSARVFMRSFSTDEAAAYVATAEPMDKAGSYAVQGDGGALVERIVGCHLTVVGLPLCRVMEMLDRPGEPADQREWCPFCAGRTRSF